MNIYQLVHSTSLHTGGVAKSTHDLSEAFFNLGISSQTSEKTNPEVSGGVIIAHGLWQWPGVSAYNNWKKKQIPYMVFPHGMLDPWFKKAYPLKHIKKQLYWWWKQGKILEHAHAVCFTTEEERKLAQKTFWPYRCREIVTGLGVGDPPGNDRKQVSNFNTKFPQTRGKKFLLYMGRIHPKKGLDLLLKAFARQKNTNDLLVIAGPISEDDALYKTLRKDFKHIEKQVLWTDMLERDLKWGALRAADCLILPSHQENYGMVVAEACSVGTPVLLSNKVNLYHEILEYDAGMVEDDTQRGIDQLVDHWVRGSTQGKSQNARKCFRDKLHISKTAEKIIGLFEEATSSTDS